jgi:hypothetical protein
MEPAGPGPRATEEAVPAPAPLPVAGDTVDASVTPGDSAFWYLVLAGYVDTRTAHAASESVVESSLTVADRAGRTCVYGTFAGGDVDQTARVRSGLEQWTAAAPADLDAAVSVHPDGTLQLVSCDPGDGFVHPTRPGVARELVAWRVAELATYDHLLADSTGDAQAVPSSVFDPAWFAVAASDLPISLAGLPPDTPLDVIATTAREGVVTVLGPAG